MYSLVQWNWFSEVTEACTSGASSDVREPISLHQAVHVEMINLQSKVKKDLFRIKPKGKNKGKGIERKKRFSKNRGMTLRFTEQTPSHFWGSPSCSPQKLVTQRYPHLLVLTIQFRLGFKNLTPSFKSIAFLFLPIASHIFWSTEATFGESSTF